MSPEEKAFLSLPRLPAIVTEQETAWLLGFPLRKIRYLVRIGKLLVLGGNTPRSQKLFATAYVLELADDPEWLSAAIKQGRRADRENNHRRTLRNRRTTTITSLDAPTLAREQD